MMAGFDLSTAKPASSGFDLSTATPVDTSGIPVGRTTSSQEGTMGAYAPRRTTPNIPSMFTTATEPVAEAQGSMAALRGLTSSVLGIPGSIGGMFNPNRTEAESVQDATPENIRKLYAKLGWAEPTTEALKAAQFGGAAVPDIAVAGSLGLSATNAARNALANRAVKTQAANVAASYANAPMIEGTQAAHRLGGAVNPAISNPTIGNRARGALAGPEIVEANLAKKNAVEVTDRVREDLGLTSNQPLNADAIEGALDKAGKPNDIVRKMPVLAPDATVIDQLTSLKIPKLIGDKGTAAEVNSIIDDAIKNVNNGSSGEFILDSIRQLRKQAQTTFKNKDRGTATAIEVDAANARMGTANALESLIDANVKDPNVLGDIKLARTRQGQIYDHARALDYGQQKVDPQAYAKMYEERQGKGMSGVGQDIALAASTHPSVFTLTPAVEGKFPRFSRAGAGGLAGATIGSVVGGPIGAAAGLAAGAGMGSVAGGLAARRMATPAYQAARAMPTDYRPAQNMLRPVEPNYGPNQMVPYDYSQSVVMPGETPNWVPGRPEAQVNVSTPYAPNQLPAPSAAGTLGTIAAERARAAGMSRTMGAQAEAQQAAAEVATRQPARGGTPLVFDTTGKLIEAPAAGAGGVVGAPTSLESAVKKLSGIVVPETQTTYKTQTISPKTGAKPYTRITKKEGETTFERGVSQAFDLTSEERIAWNKSKADLAVASPELKGLTDKAIAEKMMDRQWVSDTVGKIREKAQAFDEISKRASTAQAARDASMKREQMMDLLADLEDSLRPARPVQKGGQGPKTRAFQRNMLTPEQEIQNALIGQ